MEHGDYKMIAHISNKGEVKWYVKPGYTPALDVIKIREAAAIQQNKYETWRASLSDAERYQITLDEMSCTELVAHLRAKRAERGGERMGTGQGRHPSRRAAGICLQQGRSGLLRVWLHRCSENPGGWSEKNVVEENYFQGTRMKMRVLFLLPVRICHWIGCISPKMRV